MGRGGEPIAEVALWRGDVRYQLRLVWRGHTGRWFVGRTPGGRGLWTRHFCLTARREVWV